MESLKSANALHRKKSLSALLALTVAGSPTLSQQEHLKMKQVRLAQKQSVISFTIIRNIVESINEGD